MSETCKEKVYRSLFDELSDRLYSYAFHKYGEEANPQDMVQEAFIKLWENCAKVPLEKAKSYLFTIVSNRSLNELDKAKTKKNYQAQTTLTVSSATPHDIAEEKEYVQKLNQALDEMPEGQRIAFMMNRVEGMKHKEIAEALDISQKAVEKRIYQGAAFLLKKLGRKI